MKNILILLWVFTGIIFSYAENSTLVMSPSKTYQVLEGFGASGAWWSPEVGLWKPDQRKPLLTLLYDPEKGAGLTRYRIHIGAGGKEELMNDLRRVPTIETAPGKYDLTRDTGAVTVAKEVIARGIKQITAFTCAPPGRLTFSGKVVADKDQKVSNLPPENYKPYAHYICDIVKLLIDDGIPIDTVSPLNEPQWDWNNTLGEGVKMSPEEVVNFLNVYREVAREKIPDVKLEVIDSGAWSHTRRYIEAIMKDQDLLQSIDSFSIHSYWSNDQHRIEFMKWYNQQNLPQKIHMTEWCEMKHGRHPEIESGILLAETVISDLVIAEVSSWTHWLATSYNDFCDSLITYDKKTRKLETNKRLWCLASFSRFIRPGWIRIDAQLQDRPVIAAMSPDKNKIACVIINRPDKSKELTYILPDYTLKEVWVTSADKDLEKIQTPSRQKLNLTSTSITTLIFQKQ